MDNIVEAQFEDLPQMECLLNASFRGIGTNSKGWTTDTNFITGNRVELKDLQKCYQRSNVKFYKYIDPQTQCMLACGNIEMISNLVMYFGNLAVDPDHQSRGIGKNFLNFVENLARNNSVKKIQITVVSVRIELLEWYLRQGWTKTGQIQEWDMSWNVGCPKVPLHMKVLEKDIF